MCFAVPPHTTSLQLLLALVCSKVRLSVKALAFRVLASLVHGRDRDVSAAVLDAIEGSRILPQPRADTGAVAGSGLGGSRVRPVDGASSAGIVFELEQLESESRSYSTTASFVGLLRALFSCSAHYKPSRGWIRMRVDPHLT